MAVKNFILASGSPQRKRLLENIGYEPKEIHPADIDEHVISGEKPLPYIRRMALTKAKAVKELFPDDVILSADTIIVVGQKIIQKSPNDEAEIAVLQALSGRTHRVITSVCVINKDGHVSQKTITTKIVMKKLTKAEIEEYIASGEWHGVCGYKIEGLLSGFVKKMIGSYTGVIGLPVYEARNLLNSAGIR